MSAPATINNGDVPDATKLMLWFNFLLAGKGVKQDTLANLIANQADLQLAYATDYKQLMFYTGDATIGDPSAPGWIILGGGAG